MATREPADAGLAAAHGSRARGISKVAARKRAADAGDPTVASVIKSERQMQPKENGTASRTFAVCFVDFDPDSGSG